MSGRQFRILLVAVVVSGVIGGMLSDYLLRSTATSARAELTGPAPEPGKETLVAHRLLIVDEQGNPRATLDPWGLSVNDSDSRAGISLLLGDGETVRPRLSLTNGRESFGTLSASVTSNGVPHLELYHNQRGIHCSADGSCTYMRLYSKGDGGGIRLAADADEDATIVLEEADGQGSTGLRRLADGTGGLWISDSGGIERARVKVASDGSPEFRLRDKKQQTIWSAP
jgi:hypothetical protein